jgi:hypothetical protein
MDAAMPAAKSGGYGSADNGDPDDVDINTPDSSGDDLGDKIRQLLEGKLDDADIAMLIQLIEGPDETDPAPPAQDRGKRGRQAHDRLPVMPSKATVERLLAEGAARRAERVLQAHENLTKRFPALKNARVGG